MEHFENVPEIIPDEYSFLGNEEELLDYVMPLGSNQKSKSKDASLSKSSFSSNKSRSKVTQASMDQTSINHTVKMGQFLKTTRRDLKDVISKSEL